MGVTEPEAGHVVPQRVPPHVDDLRRIAGHRYPPPMCAAVRPRHGEVVQPTIDQRQNLVPPRRRFDAQPTTADQIPELRGVAREPKEPVLLGHDLRLGPVLGASPGGQVLGCVELLAPNAIKPGVVLAIQVPARIAQLPQPLDATAVPRIAARANEVVKGQIERPPQRRERLGIAIDELLHRHALRLSRQHVLQRVVIRPRQRTNLLAPLPRTPSKHVPLHQFEREPQVRPRVDVGNRRRDVGPRCSHPHCSVSCGDREPGPIRENTKGPVLGPRMRISSVRQQPRVRGIICTEDLVMRQC